MYQSSNQFKLGDYIVGQDTQCEACVMHLKTFCVRSTKAINISKVEYVRDLFGTLLDMRFEIKVRT